MSTSDITSVFDELRFFTILLTGGLFIIGLVPFLPSGILQFQKPILLVVTLFVIAYFIGQGIYEVSAFLQNISPFESHRTLLIQELDDPEFVDPKIVQKAKSICAHQLDINENKEATDIGSGEITYPMMLGSLYSQGNAFSVSLQTMYTFFRSGLLTLVILFFIYTANYTFPFNISPTKNASYLLVFESYEKFYFYSIPVYISGIIIFYQGYRSNAKYFIEYLFCDFVRQNTD